eukprot:scaffold17556_cov57-Phaeocystis_antarctica.AAC.1
MGVAVQSRSRSHKVPVRYQPGAVAGSQGGCAQPTVPCPPEALFLCRCSCVSLPHRPVATAVPCGHRSGRRPHGATTSGRQPCGATVSGRDGGRGRAATGRVCRAVRPVNVRRAVRPVASAVRPAASAVPCGRAVRPVAAA